MVLLSESNPRVQDGGATTKEESTLRGEAERRRGEHGRGIGEGKSMITNRLKQLEKHGGREEEEARGNEDF